VMHKIIFKHWQTGEQLEVTGRIDPQLNHPSSDRLVVTKPDGTLAQSCGAYPLVIVNQSSMLLKGRR